MSKQKFTRAHIQEIIRSGAGLDIHQARAITARIIEALAAAIIAGQAVELRGLGTFLLKSRKSRKAHNPKTGKPVDVPAHKAVVFRPCGRLKAAVKNLTGDSAGKPAAPDEGRRNEING
jgi:nucleoid DNA-binding protein